MNEMLAINNIHTDRVALARHNRDIALGLSEKFIRHADGNYISWSHQESWARLIANFAYLSERDKGNPEEPLATHIDAVLARALKNYSHHLTPKELRRLTAAVVLHEILEIRDDGDAEGNNKQAIWLMQDLEHLGLVEEVITDVDGLGKRTDELYLDYIQRLAQSSLFAIRAKISDLEVNLSPDRNNGSHHHNTDDLGEGLKIKKQWLYPAAHEYLTACEAGRIDPRQVSVITFIASKKRKSSEIEVLSRYTKQTPRMSQLMSLVNN